MALLQSQGLTGRSHGFQEGRINLSNADKNLRNPGFVGFHVDNPCRILVTISGSDTRIRAVSIIPRPLAFRRRGMMQNDVVLGSLHPI